MATTSKNIYNCCIFTNNIVTIFKNKVYKKVYNFFLEIKNSELLTKDDKNKLYENNHKIILYYFKKYYDFYITNIDLIKFNNNIIFKYIKTKLNNVILNSKNIKNYQKIIFKELKNIIKYDNTNKHLVFIDIVKRIIKSFYDKKYFLCKYQTNNHIPLTFYNVQLLEDIKNDNYYYHNNNIINYKNEINNDFIVINSDQYIFKCFVYEYCLGNNKSKLPADITLNIIDKYYECIKSYYGLLNKKIKANKPNYKGKNELSNLYYFPSSFKIINNNIRLNVGKHISTLYNSFKFYKIENFENKYCKYEHIINSDNKKYTKDKKYVKIANNKYVNKKDIIESNYLYIKYPKILKNKEIKLIQIKPYGNTFNILITYNLNENITKDHLSTLSINPTTNNSISIDLGMKNLMTIYNPTGTQHIINGGRIKSINEFYNKKISDLKSINKKTLNINTFNRMYSLLNERKNKINGEINKLINLLITTYNDKKVFIIGYNHGWKTKVNLNQNTNRMFYEIPYKRIIIKLEEKLKSLGKQMIITEESYTSKCDSLNLEKIGKKDFYDGKRKNRGLFISKIGKAINADLNGAINIMRKVIDFKNIYGLMLFNPTFLGFNA
jgi:IS605 OrfB family transposase